MDEPHNGLAIRATNVSQCLNYHGETLTILSNINLEITQGETIAITGVSGSGKTTLISLLAGLDKPSSGDIEILDQEITQLSDDDRARMRGQSLGFIFQDFQLLPNLTALENCMLPLELRNDAQAREQATSLLKHVGLEHRLSHYPSQLSGGEQQRVAIARAFSTQPRILFADEPTGNLDQKTALVIADLLFSLNQDRGTTLVLVTHDDMISAQCQRQIVLEGGRIYDH